MDWAPTVLHREAPTPRGTFALDFSHPDVHWAWRRVGSTRIKFRQP